jgi:hypothetical protein
MTIERQYGRIIFVCDVERSPRCEELLDTKTGDFPEALEMAKSQGWLMRPEHPGSRDWLHWCRFCPRP